MHAAERLAQHGADLLLLVRRELVDDAVDGAGGAGGVQRAEHEVTRLRRLDGDGDGLEVAHLTHQHDVRVLAQGGAQGALEARGVLTDARAGSPGTSCSGARTRWGLRW
jgi:hypothetical protein